MFPLNFKYLDGWLYSLTLDACVWRLREEERPLFVTVLEWWKACRDIFLLAGQRVTEEQSKNHTSDSCLSSMTAALQNQWNLPERARGNWVIEADPAPAGEPPLQTNQGEILTYTDLSGKSGKFHWDGGRKVTEGHPSVGCRREIGEPRKHAA